MLKGKPFVKWAGGKRQIIDKLKEYAPIEFNTYYEPFVGGGALLFELSPKTAVIDLNVLSDALNIEVKESFDLLPYSFCSIYFLKFFKFFSSIELFWNFLILVIVI